MDRGRAEQDPDYRSPSYDLTFQGDAFHRWVGLWPTKELPATWTRVIGPVSLDEWMRVLHKAREEREPPLEYRGIDRTRLPGAGNFPARAVTAPVRGLCAPATRGDRGLGTPEWGRLAHPAQAAVGGRGVPGWSLVAA